MRAGHDARHSGTAARGARALCCVWAGWCWSESWANGASACATKNLSHKTPSGPTPLFLYCHSMRPLAHGSRPPPKVFWVRMVVVVANGHLLQQTGNVAKAIPPPVCGTPTLGCGGWWGAVFASSESHCVVVRSECGRKRIAVAISAPRTAKFAGTHKILLLSTTNN